MDGFQQFAMWALQAILGGTVVLLMAVIGWEIKSRLALQRQVDRHCIHREALTEQLAAVLKPIEIRLDALEHSQRQREQALDRRQMQLIRVLNEIGARLNLTCTVEDVPG